MPSQDYTVLEIKFIAKIRHKSKGIKFPEVLHRALRLKKDGRVALMVRKLSGELVFCEVAKLTSKNELTARKIFRNLDRDEEIVVTASHP